MGRVAAGLEGVELVLQYQGYLAQAGPESCQRPVIGRSCWELVSHASNCPSALARRPRAFVRVAQTPAPGRAAGTQAGRDGSWIKLRPARPLGVRIGRRGQHPAGLSQFPMARQMEVDNRKSGVRLRQHKPEWLPCDVRLTENVAAPSRGPVILPPRKCTLSDPKPTRLNSARITQRRPALKEPPHSQPHQRMAREGQGRQVIRRWPSCRSSGSSEDHRPADGAESTGRHCRRRTGFQRTSRVG